MRVGASVNMHFIVLTMCNNTPKPHKPPHLIITKLALAYLFPHLVRILTCVTSMPLYVCV